MNNTCTICGKEIVSSLKNFIPGVGEVCFVCSCTKDLAKLKKQMHKDKKEGNLNEK